MLVDTRFLRWAAYIEIALGEEATHRTRPSGFRKDFRVYGPGSCSWYTACSSLCSLRLQRLSVPCLSLEMGTGESNTQAGQTWKVVRRLGLDASRNASLLAPWYGVPDDARSCLLGGAC